MPQTFWRESCVKFSTPPHVATRAHARTDGDETIVDPDTAVCCKDVTAVKCTSPPTEIFLTEPKFLTERYIQCY